MLISGANTFTYEVLWTRLLSHILGGSIVAFSTMLAAFLSGIAIGSALAARYARNAGTALTAFVAYPSSASRSPRSRSTRAFTC